MSSGIAKIVDGFSAAWSMIHDGDRCAYFFGSEPIPDPLPEGYRYADSHEDSYTAVQTKQHEVHAAYAAAIEAGYDTGYGFALKLSEQDQRVLFDYQQRLLRQLAQDPPQTTTAALKVIKGTDDQWHVATVAQIIEAIDGGADHIESLSGAYAGYEAMLAAGVVDFEVVF